jgi:hypothetical protein
MLEGVKTKGGNPFPLKKMCKFKGYKPMTSDGVTP